jgi:putative glutamine amidotransferase
LPGFGRDVRMLRSMVLTDSNLPRIGIPWRTAGEEAAQDWAKIRAYEQAVRTAGGDPVVLSLTDPEELERQLPSLDGFVLPGSPADVDPREYGARNEGRSEPADPAREQADRALLRYAFAHKRPVLAICYGCQLLNVYLGGTLVQDVRSETGTELAHRRTDVQPAAEEDPMHGARFRPGSLLSVLARGPEAVVNSSHHQAVAKAGAGLEVTGYASDGTVESVEWKGDKNWVIGVQWHPERMTDDPLAKRLFSEFVAASRAERIVRAAGN